MSRSTVADITRTGTFTSPKLTEPDQIARATNVIIPVDKDRAMDDQEFEQALDDLFATPPEEFVSVRNALARELKAAGRTDDAKITTTWRRPTRVIWMLDHLALSGDDTVPALVDAAHAVRELQSSGQSGLREAMVELRGATRCVTEAAVEVLDPVRPNDQSDVAAALLSIVSDPDALMLLAQGRLLDVPEAGFAGFAVGAARPTVPAGASEDRAAQRTLKASRSPTDRGSKDQTRARHEAQEAQAAQDAHAAQAAQDAQAAQAAQDAQAAEAARAACELAEKDLRRAVAEAEAAEDSMQRASERVDQIRTELLAAEAACEQGAQSAERAHSTLEDAERALEDASTHVAQLGQRTDG